MLFDALYDDETAPSADTDQSSTDTDRARWAATVAAQTLADIMGEVD